MSGQYHSPRPAADRTMVSGRLLGASSSALSVQPNSAHIFGVDGYCASGLATEACIGSFVSENLCSHALTSCLIGCVFI